MENLCFVSCFSMDLNCSLKYLLFESVLMRWMNLELIIQSEVSQKEKNKYCISIRIWNLER